MSAGQTGHMTGRMEHVHGTDGTHTHTPGGVPSKFFMFLGFFLSPIGSSGSGRDSLVYRAEKNPPKILGVHSPNLQRETSTGVLANFSQELTNFKRKIAESK